MAIKLFFKNRSFWLAFGLAVIFVIVSYLMNTNPRGWLSSLRILELILTTIELPALIIAALVSDLQNYRGFESPNVIAFYVTLFVTYIVFGGVIKLVGFVNKRMLKNTKT